MIPARKPTDEEARLKSVDRYLAVMKEDDYRFDELTKLASYICNTEISIISIITQDKQLIKSRVGIDATETSRDEAFCAHAILEDEILIVPDAEVDERFRNNPLVVGGPKIRFYTGIVLKANNGDKIGTLCAIDSKVKQLSPEQINSLKILAKQVMSQFELRLSHRETELARAEAVKASQAKSAFLANMSHEIRTPLNSIIGLSDLLLHTPLNDDQTKHVNIINQSGEMLVSLINDILDLSKIESGGLKLEMLNVSFHELVQRTAGFFSFRVSEKKLQLETYVQDDLRMFIGDPTRVSQILINLLSNALKFTTSGTVSLRIERNPTNRKGNLLISVKDSGIGISEDKFNVIFEKFSQAEMSTTRQYGGTGLGLAICKNLVTMMGGEIWVESTQSKGSTFNFTLDLIEYIKYR